MDPRRYRGYGERGNRHQERDVGINTIKLSLPIFKGESDPEVYLAWESACDKVFQVNDISEEKKSCYAITHFECYANTWWEYFKRFGNELVEG